MTATENSRLLAAQGRLAEIELAEARETAERAEEARAVQERAAARAVAEQELAAAKAEQAATELAAALPPAKQAIETARAEVLQGIAQLAPALRKLLAAQATYETLWHRVGPLRDHSALRSVRRPPALAGMDRRVLSLLDAAIKANEAGS